MRALVTCVLPALAATLVALAACSSTPEPRYTPGNIDNSASDASGTAIRQTDQASPAQVPEECKNADVKSRVDACNPPKGPVSNPGAGTESPPTAPPPTENPPPR
jgi:hypothetical protein